MAGLAFRLHERLGCPLWISGYGELGKKGLFHPYARELTRLFASAPEAKRESLWLFRHFSMNQFAIEMRMKADRKTDLIAGDGVQGSGSQGAGDSARDIAGRVPEERAPRDLKAELKFAELARIGTENRKRILGF